MKRLSKAAKLGIYIEVIAIASMLVFVILSRSIPEFIYWLFLLGLGISIISILVELKLKAK